MRTFKWDAYIAELIGTFVLVFVGSVSVTVYEGNVAYAGHNGILPIALAHGLALMIMVYTIGQISGCHINPAVTVGMWITRKISDFDGAMYIIFQLIGAAFAGVLHEAILPNVGAPGNYGLTYVNTDVISEPTGLLVEAVLTFLLVFVVFGTVFHPKAQPGFAGLAIGMTLAAGIIIGGPLTGGALNPARWFGPAVTSGELSEFWVYFLGPIIGGAIAAVLYNMLFLKGELKGRQ